MPHAKAQRRKEKLASLHDVAQRKLSPTRRALALFSLVLAGEAVFMPVFYLGRYFQSSLLAVFGLTEVQKGELYAWYGAVAMACYLLGGPLADRVAPRKLIAGSLLATAVGGLYMADGFPGATLPGFTELRWLYAFWGASTIFAFWAPLIRATRDIGGDDAQGKAFGVLDGGRGLVAALVAFVAVRGCLILYGTDALENAESEIEAIRGLLHFFAAVGGVAAVTVWLLLPDPPEEATPATTGDAVGPADVLRRVAAVAQMPAIWLQALVVIAAYSAFKTLDQYGLYCEDAYGLTKDQSAGAVAWLTVLRIGAALAAGVIADRLLGAAGTILASFGTLLIGFATLLLMPRNESLFPLAVATIAITCAAFFGLRGVYFALFEENNVPEHLTGTAVGLVSFVGFTPEIFMPLVTGSLITSARESGDVLIGYERLFTLLAILSAVGFAAALALRMIQRRAPGNSNAN